MGAQYSVCGELIEHQSTFEPPLPTTHFRILCYGDSLTAGFHNYGKGFSPYGNTLRESLSKRRGVQCDVSICGMSGHLAEQMVKELDNDECRDMCGKFGEGLAHILDNHDRYDLVIIMAGTNDLSHANVDLHSVCASICKLHKACHKRGVPTLMLNAPCASEEIRCKLGDLLGAWAACQTHILGFIDPEDVIPRKRIAFWEMDRVHFSPAGSHALGVHLAPKVATILKQRSQHSSSLMPFGFVPSQSILGHADCSESTVVLAY